jgi:hypothetical protein
MVMLYLVGDWVPHWTVLGADWGSHWLHGDAKKKQIEEQNMSDMKLSWKISLEL